MSLFKCPECGNQISSNATSCPHCGNPNPHRVAPQTPHSTAPITYENKVVHVTCWGLGGSNAIIEKLAPELRAGWEIVSTTEDYWRGGALRHVYTVVLKRNKAAAPTEHGPAINTVLLKRNKVAAPTEQKNIFNIQYQKITTHDTQIDGWQCKKCGEYNSKSNMFCKCCGTLKQ